MISPKAELVSRVRKAGGRRLSDLAEPVLWIGSEYDKSSLSGENMDLLVKFLFLDSLIRERGDIPEYRQVFPAVCLSEAAFDSDWLITRVPLNDSVGEAINSSIGMGSISALTQAIPKERLKKYLEKCRQHGGAPADEPDEPG